MTYKLDEAGKLAAKEYVKKWTDIALKTGVMTPEERKHCVEQVHKIYENAGLAKPIVVIAPSPFVARFATGAACAHYYAKDQKGSGDNVDDAVVATDDAIEVATRRAIKDVAGDANFDAIKDATYYATSVVTVIATNHAVYRVIKDATFDVVYNATRDTKSVYTRDSTYNATYDAIHDATIHAIDDATDVATNYATGEFVKLITSETYKGSHGCIAAVMQSAGKFGLLCTKEAWRLYQGGNAWSHSACFIEFGRDHCKLGELGLGDQSIYEKYQPWEELAKISGFRYVHEKFCIVSDRPIKYNFDENNELHCEDGPAVEWSDGTAIHAWHGIHVPWKWIEDKDNLNPEEVLSTENVEQRAAGIQILGIHNLLDKLDHKIIDYDEDPSHGELIEVTIPGLPNPVQYLKAECPRNGIIMEGVPMISDIDDKPIKTVRAAQAWGIGLAESEFEYPSIRT